MRSIDRTRAKMAPGMLACALILYGCVETDRPQNESTDAEKPVILTGRFVAPIVAGMAYRSGSQSGVTDENGTFRYEKDKPLELSAAGVALPIATLPALTEFNPSQIGFTVIREEDAPLVITPANLSDNAVVIFNVTHFLKMLDVDGDPGNGVRISEAVQKAKASPVDWTADIESAAAQLRADAVSLDGTTHDWPSEAETIADGAQRRTCALSGLSTGTLKGESFTVRDPTDDKDRSETTHAYLFTVVKPPFFDLIGYARFSEPEPSPRNGGNYRLEANEAPMNGNMSADLTATMHESGGTDWPFTNTVESAPTLQLSLSWTTDGIKGTWASEGSKGGTVAATSMANNFNAVQRFVHFPVTWRHARGHLMYATLIVEIDAQSAVVARMIDGQYWPNSHFLKGNISGDTITAVEKDWLTGTKDTWKLTATLNRETMQITGQLYQWDGTMAHDFDTDPMYGCAL